MRPRKPAAVKKAPAHRRRHWLIVAAAAAIVALLAVFGIGLYRFGWSGPVARIVTEVVPYPAAIVDGSVIRYVDFQDGVAALERFYREEKAKAPPGSAFAGEGDIRSRVLDRLVRDQLAVNLAARRGIAVTADDIEKKYRSAVIGGASSGIEGTQSELRAEQALNALYGLTPSEFKTRMLRPFLVRQKLVAAILKDDAVNAEKLKKALSAIDALKAGKPFRDVAKSYGEDANVTSTGGERGWIGRGLLPPAVEAAAFALKPGETSGIVRDEIGYHILQVADRKMSGGKVTQVELREIVIHPVSLDDYLDDQLKSASVITFVH